MNLKTLSTIALGMGFGVAFGVLFQSIALGLIFAAMISVAFHVPKRRS